ncbi:MAG: monooxygenase, FAD-binding protein [Tardiphaga sp.]|nr:monooxygenase, FAD-binding protein [Tardiphaga sp.]
MKETDMIETDIAVVGGGLAGSTAAAMLGRAGISTVMIDPHEIYPPDFRCEKISGPHIDALKRTGLADLVLPATTFDGDKSDGTSWISRFGRLVDRRPGDQHGIMYDDFVNTMRRAIPDHVPHYATKVTGLTTSADRQHVTLSDGQVVSARLVILASGLNVGIRHWLGIEREVISPCHSITIGFNMKPVGRAAFDFGSLTHYTERLSDKVAYITLFPIGDAMRANLFTYRGADDPWLRDIRHDPVATLRRLMPHLADLTGDFEVEGPLKIRPADLYVSKGHLQPGVVVVGDAFSTSCPAAGTGSYKVFTDVERLCNVHIPAWLRSEGMGAEKIAAFYDDPVKRACDEFSYKEAQNLRSMSIDSGLKWQMHRWARFGMRLASGTFRRRLRGARMVKTVPDRREEPALPHQDRAA